MAKSANQGASGASPAAPTATSSHAAAVRRAGRLGRNIATFAYLGGLLYIIAVGFATVVPQVFWPQGAAAAPSEDCRSALRTLQDELLAQGGQAFGGDEAADADFFHQWDGTFIALRDRCGDADGYQELERLRFRLESTLRRFEREDRKLIERAQRALGQNDQ